MGHLMGHQGLHRNHQTGEVLAQNVQVCTMCWKNFSSDDAWEKHWDRKKLRGQRCMNPEEVGLVAFSNTKGATIYRTRGNPID
jgi:hypothetical protein